MTRVSITHPSESHRSREPAYTRPDKLPRAREQSNPTVRSGVALGTFFVRR